MSMGRIWFLTFIGFGLLGSLIAKEKIIGGRTSTNLEVPWQVSLQTRGGSHFCGGVLLNKKFVLTAAHCVESSGPRSVRVKGSSRNGSTRSLKELSKVEKITIHPDFDPSQVTAHDIALIELKRAVNFSDSLQAISLPEELSFEVAQEFKNLDSENLMASGWGMTTIPGSLPLPSKQLYLTNLSPVASSSVDFENEDIVKLLIETFDFGKGTIEKMKRLNSKVLMMGDRPNRSTCFGDSGGPLTYWGADQPVLMGISSFVAGGDRACTQISAFTNVQAYLEWIQETMNR